MMQTYFAQLQAVVDQYASTDFVLETNLNFETRPGDQAYLAAAPTLDDVLAEIFTMKGWG